MGNADKPLNRCSKRLAEGEGRAGWEGGGVGWGGRLSTFSAFRMGAYLRWALIQNRGWAFIRINTVTKAANMHINNV